MRHQQCLTLTQIVVIIIFVMLLDEMVAQNDSPCPPGYSTGFLSIACYKYPRQGSVSWHEANKTCTEDGHRTHLVIITNDEENEWVNKLGVSDKWIGLNRFYRPGEEPEEGYTDGWKFEQGQGPPNYFAWQNLAGSSEQDPDSKDPNIQSAVDVKCVSLQHATEQWSDRSCSSAAGYRFVCQAPGPPTSQPTSSPSRSPSIVPTSAPTLQPAASPTMAPSSQPSMVPTSQPFAQPTSGPSSQPVGVPSLQPICSPTSKPTQQPFAFPTSKPSTLPTSVPTIPPTSIPTGVPTQRPTAHPISPSFHPTPIPTTDTPTASPTNVQPTYQPTYTPTFGPFGIEKKFLIANANVESLTDNYRIAMQSTIAAATGIALDKVSIIDGVSGRRKLLQEYKLGISAVIQASYADSTETMTEITKETISDHFDSLIADYILSGNATKHFRAILEARGTADDNVEVLFYSATESNGVQSDAKSSNETLMLGIIVASGILVLAFLAATITWCYHRFASRKKAEAETDNEWGLSSAAGKDFEDPSSPASDNIVEWGVMDPRMSRSGGQRLSKSCHHSQEEVIAEPLATANGKKLPNTKEALEFLRLKEQFNNLVKDDDSLKEYVLW